MTRSSFASYGADAYTAGGGTPVGAALDALADRDPDLPALTCGDVSLTRRQLASASNRLARRLAGLGVGAGDLVTIGLPNGVEHFVAVVAAWKLGAVPQPVSARLPAAELGALLELADPPVVIGLEPPDGRPWVPAGFLAEAGTPAGGTPAGGAGSGPREGRAGSGPREGRAGSGPRESSAGSVPDAALDSPLPPVTPPCWKAPTSGGSTGRPKIILSGGAGTAEVITARAGALRIEPDSVFLVTAPLYHNAPFMFSLIALVLGGHVVVMPRFDPADVLAAVARHRVTWLYAVPTLMGRILRLPAATQREADLSSVRTLLHVGEPCPEHVKRAWLDRLDPERIVELYAGTESIAVCMIDGREWLERPGSVGRPASGEIMIGDEDGRPLPVGEVGEVWMRPPPGVRTYRYLGAEARGAGSWESIGDMGRLDADGYLYLSDRRQDMILVGGANVYPAEVEAALSEHARVLSSAVIGLPDEDLGNTVHAIVQLSGPLSDDELREHLRARLAPYKLPRSFERTDEPLRDDAGKVRRSALRAARLP